MVVAATVSTTRITKYQIQARLRGGGDIAGSDEDLDLDLDLDLDRGSRIEDRGSKVAGSCLGRSFHPRSSILDRDPHRPARSVNVSGSSALAMTTTPWSVTRKPRWRSCSRL